MSGIAIGLDLGTSGLRAALVDARGEEVAFAAAPFTLGMRRDPMAWWDGVHRAIEILRTRADLSQVQAIAVDGTSGSLLAVDPAGLPLGEASLYSDIAEPRDVEAVAAVASPDSAARGATSPLARLLRMASVPGVGRVLHEADWIAGMLRGRFDTTDANNALKTGFDPRVGAWPDWVRALGGDLLPRVVPAGAPLSRILPDVARRLGLPAQTLVVAGTTDGCAAFLATGAAESGEAVTSLGTTLTIKLLSDVPVFSPRDGIYSHLVQGRWLAGGASNSGGGALLRHFDASSVTRLSELIDPARESGLDYYPLPAPGERFPIADPDLRPRESPRPDDDVAFLHGLLEGIARIEALAYARLVELGAPSVIRLRTVGGGARNATWAALRARVLGMVLVASRSEEAAVGTAGLALSALG